MPSAPISQFTPTKLQCRLVRALIHYVACLFGLILAVILMKAGLHAIRKSHELVISPDRPRKLGEFTLTDRTGHPFRRSQLQHQYCVVSFVFTSCGSKCLLVSRQMEDIQQLTEGQADVRLVSFTIDPRTDTPQVLAKFAATYHADTNRWLFLTGERSVILPLIETSFLSRAVPDDDRFSDLFLNTERIALLDPAGVVRAYFDGTRPNISLAVVEELRQLRHSNRIQ